MNAPDLALAGRGAAPQDGAAWTVLCVDDEVNILSALKRSLRGAGYRVLTATGGQEALALLEQTSVEVLLSDMRMPGMDGAQLLEQVHARWPQVSRLLLTGQASVESSMAAINRGHILRYLRKPWDEVDLLGAVHEGVARVALEREKLRLETLTRAQNQELKGLNASLETRVRSRTAELSDANQRLQRNHLKLIKVFSNVLEVRSEQLAGHGRQVAETARDIARAMGLSDENTTHIFVAGLLHDIGLIGTMDKLLSRPLSRYNPDEMDQFRSHAVLGEQLLMALDDLQPALPFIRGHHERFDGTGFPDKLAGTEIPLGARILAVADAFDYLQRGLLVESRLSTAETRTLMRQARGTQFCPEVLDVFLHITEPHKAKTRQEPLLVPTSALQPEMELAADLVSGRGILMLTAGHTLTPALIRRVREFEQREGSRLKILIKPRSPT